MYLKGTYYYKILLLIVGMGILLSPVDLQAQQIKNPDSGSYKIKRLEAGIGYITLGDAFVGIGNFFSNNLSLPYDTSRIDMLRPAYNFKLGLYRHNLLEFDMTLAYQTATVTTYSGKSGEINRLAEISIISVMPQLRINWSPPNNNLLNGYSSISFGLSGYVNDVYSYGEREVYTIPMLAGQINLVGVRIGKTFGGYFEFGFGNEGLLKAGISWEPK